MVKIISSSLLLVALLCMGCGKEKISLNWSYLSTTVDGHWSKIVIAPSGLGYMVGGDEWYLGTAGQTTDGGESWTFDSISNKRLYDVYIDESDNAYTVGVDGYLYTKEPAANWEFHRLFRYQTNRGVAHKDLETGIIGSGAAFGNGILTSYKKPNVPEKETMLDFEISDVCFSDDQTMHAVGYGVVLSSKDNGLTWDWADVSNDYFQAIQFVNEQVGYIVGLTGSILKTTDGGASWRYLRDSQKALTKDYAMRDLYFEDEQNGYVCGEEGLLWYTKDGGENWTQVIDLPDEIFNSVATFEGKGYLVGEYGIFIEFDLPE